MSDGGDGTRGSDGPVAGWYPDPDVHGGQRYWDGGRWTDDRRTPAPPGGSPQPAPGSAPSARPPSSPWGAGPGGGSSGAGPGGGSSGASWSTAGAPAAPIDTWLWQSIVATIFCCQPFGIAAIVFSAMAGSARDAGDLALARHRAAQARTWTLVSVGTVLVLIVGFVLFAVLGVVFSA